MTKEELVDRLLSIDKQISTRSWITAGGDLGELIDELREEINYGPFINTSEVKDVDLDNEIIDYINEHYHIRFDETLERGNDPLTTIDFEEIARHFFELGMQVSNKAHKGE